jgi:DNA primase
MIGSLSKERIARARDALSVSDVVGHYVALTKGGREFVARCPFHAEKTPSFTVNDDKGFYHCFGCGAHGDALAFVQKIEDKPFMDALAILEGLAGLGEQAPGTREPVASARVGPEPLSKGAADASDQEKRISRAKALWEASVPIAGTPGEAYLRGRGIARLPDGDNLRFNAAARHDIERCDLPALICKVSGRDNQFVGVWRIFLQRAAQRVGEAGEAARWEKARVAKPKLGLGVAAGGACRLYPAAPQIALAEGIETALSITEACADLPAWACLSTGGLRAVELPDDVQEVVICADHDPRRRDRRGRITQPGRDAAEDAAARLIAEGRKVWIAQPAEPDSDWNDVLREGVEWTG